MTGNPTLISSQRIYLLIILLAMCLGLSSAVLCYDCNSKYDPRCGDPFDPYSLGQINCSKSDLLEHLRDVKPTICRKITQKIFGKVHVIRGCGYLKDDRDDLECLKRSGTHEVQTLFCACTSDYCNSSNRLQSNTIINNNIIKQLMFTILFVGVISHFIYHH